MATAEEIFSKLEETRVKELFDRVDSNHDGKITADEVIKLCAEFGHEMAPERAAEIIAKHSGGGNSIDWENFVKALAGVLVKVKGAVVLVSLFRAKDVTGTGTISEAKLKELAKEAGLDVPPEKIEELVKKAGDGSGNISFREFIKAAVAYLRTR